MSETLAFLMQPEIFLTWTTLVKIGALLGLILGLVSYTVYAERRVSAIIQDRVGPNRVGPSGLFQPIADAMKLLLKENFIPESTNRFYYIIAPMLAMIPSLLVLAVLPFGSELFGVKMVIADVNIGVLWVFAITSLGVYGIVLAGWSSNSKYPFLGGIRSSSQMISYELSMGLSVIPIFMVVGTLNLPDIVSYQVENGWMVAPFWPKGLDLQTAISNPETILASFQEGFSWQRLLLWIPLVTSFLIFTLAIFAETNRLPFDLPEAEQELVGGYHTEYSSMGFALFFLGEYAAMITGSGVIVTLFLGGWSLPFVPDGASSWLWGLVNIATFFGKVICILLFMIWVRWVLPRFRYDQIMKLGWYFVFEIALLNIFITALILVYVKF
ncbi:MAG: complex I subunit 1/NuoH family protein [Chthoniobacterales bacterium]